MKIALVTGAARGIGEAIARALARDGFRVVINCSRSEDRAKALAEELAALPSQRMFPTWIRSPECMTK